MYVGKNEFTNFILPFIVIVLLQKHDSFFLF